MKLWGILPRALSDFLFQQKVTKDRQRLRLCCHSRAGYSLFAQKQFFCNAGLPLQAWVLKCLSLHKTAALRPCSNLRFRFVPSFSGFCVRGERNCQGNGIFHFFLQQFGGSFRFCLWCFHNQFIVHL